MDASLNPGLRADALRLELLYLFGGVYLDIDLALVQPLHSLLDSIPHKSLFLGVSHTPAFEVNNAILGAAPAHPLLADLINRLSASYQSHLAQMAKQRQLLQLMSQFDLTVAGKLEVLSHKQVDVIRVSGPGFMTRELFTYLAQNENRYVNQVMIFPKEYFYPVSNANRSSLTPDNYLDLIKEQVPAALQKRVYACHMWESSWQTSKE
jgi:hypothetical protein